MLYVPYFHRWPSYLESSGLKGSSHPDCDFYQPGAEMWKSLPLHRVFISVLKKYLDPAPASRHKHFMPLHHSFLWTFLYETERWRPPFRPFLHSALCTYEIASIPLQSIYYIPSYLSSIFIKTTKINCEGAIQGLFTSIPNETVCNIISCFIIKVYKTIDFIFYRP